MQKVPLAWENRACRRSCPTETEGTFCVHATPRGVKMIVSADGKGIVSQSGGLLLTRTLAGTGLDRGPSAALERWRAPRAVPDPGKIIADLAVTLALGGDCPGRYRAAAR